MCSQPKLRKTLHKEHSLTVKKGFNGQSQEDGINNHNLKCLLIVGISANNSRVHGAGIKEAQQCLCTFLWPSLHARERRSGGA